LAGACSFVAVFCLRHTDRSTSPLAQLVPLGLLGQALVLRIGQPDAHHVALFFGQRASLPASFPGGGGE